MSAVTDLQILNEIAEEIDEYGITGLPGSLRSLIKTKRGQFVAKVLEETAIMAIDLKCELKDLTEALQLKIEGLRNENQQLTDLVEELQNQLQGC